jgi:site-specific DNA recombinase
MTAAIYARKSTEQNGVADEARSVARQIENARSFAEGKGWTVDDAHIYVDDGISGAEFDARRPGLLRLLATADVKRPPFGALVMSEESRLGREQIETAMALKTIIKRGTRVFYYLTGQERTLGSPTDKLLMSVGAFADEMEREKGRQRTRDAMERLAKQGHVTGGACFGYDNVPVFTPDGRRSHVGRRINEQEAIVVRRVFALCAQGFGLRGMAHRLNEEGAASP